MNLDNANINIADRLVLAHLRSTGGLLGRVLVAPLPREECQPRKIEHTKDADQHAPCDLYTARRESARPHRPLSLIPVAHLSRREDDDDDAQETMRIVLQGPAVWCVGRGRRLDVVNDEADGNLD